MKIKATGLVIALFGAGMAAAAHGEEPAAPAPERMNAPMLLNLVTRPIESPEAAYNKELKNEVVAPAKGVETEVLPDGSVRYKQAGKTLTVTIRNPCPPGDIEHEIAAMSAYRELPGRARR